MGKVSEKPSEVLNSNCFPYPTLLEIAGNLPARSVNVSNKSKLYIAGILGRGRLFFQIITRNASIVVRHRI